MCGEFFDDDGIDLEDAAFWGGFAWTQVEGEKEERYTNDPKPEDTLKIDNDILIDENEG